MQTFIKKLSRDSEFIFSIPDKIKSEYGLEVGQIISFEVSDFVSGNVVLSKETEISSSEDETKIIFSASELEEASSSSFIDDEVYEYRIVAYSDSFSSGDVSTRFFNSIQSVMENVFCFSESSSSSGVN